MAPLARRLSPDWGILEPLQTAGSLDGQVEELCAVLDQYADLPVKLVGSSWGAMLSFILAARYPALASKLILVGSGVYQENYAAQIMQTRLARLGETERRAALSLMEQLDDPANPDRDAVMARLGALFTRADAYDPLTLDTEIIEVQYDIHQRVWDDAVRLRRSGELLELGMRIQCPVVAIHGDYDPHPADGIREPLSGVLHDFRFIPLRNCGHLPWIEAQARERFYEILADELSSE